MLPKSFSNSPQPKHLRTLIGRGVIASLVVTFGAGTTVWSQTVSAMAQAEARRRAIQVNNAREEIERGYQLIEEKKAEEALTLFTATYDSLPNIPLAQEHRMAARNGYVVAGCLHAQALAAKGDLDAANKLIEKLLSPEVAPKDARVLALQKRLAEPDRFPPALTAKHVANVEAVQTLLLKANSFIEIGDPDKAIATYQDVLRIDPYSSAARRGMEKAEQQKQRYYKAAYDHQRSKMLSAVDQTWEDQLPPTVQDVSAMFGASMQANAYGRSGREAITQKLRTLIFPTVDFAGATLDEVAELLRVRSRDLDPEGKGVSFVLNVPDDARGKPISLNLSSVPIEEVLRYVSEMCGVTYKVDDHAVTFVSISDRNGALISRTFRVPPDFIQSAPAGDAAAPPTDPFAQQAPAGGGLVIRRMGAKEFLEARGVTFPEGASAYFNSATSMLTVRNSVPNMEVVETLVEAAAKSAPKLAVVQIRMLEVNQKNVEELGFDWLMGAVGMNGNNVFLGGGSSGSGTPFNAANFPFTTNLTIPAQTLQVPNPVPPPAQIAFDVFPAIPVNGALAGPIPAGVPRPVPYGGGPITSGIRSGSLAVEQNTIDSLLQTGSATGGGAVAPGVLSVAGVFSDPQFQSVMRGLSQKKGIDVNASPSVTTKNGLKAQVEVTREFIYPTEFEPPQLPQGSARGSQMIATPTTPTAFEMRKTGVTVEVEPIISDDGRTIELTLTPELTEFEGFVNYGSPINSPASLSFLTALLNLDPTDDNGADTQVYVPLAQSEQLITPNLILQPIFKTHKVQTAVKIWDGATVVLGGVKIQKHTAVNDQVPLLGNLPFVGRFFKGEVMQTETKNVVIFVTVNVVDPSGQKINRDTASVAR
ncbi:Amuc_1098 family type IV pilus outer membrane protein [Prosthecobacter sp.]|jgi:general secretion pathway protein D|uniref:Amuc_1098 family type IV pilus outer membrane protein n=1 Tax=Prosthecobacter sp. TaxID=1965333 RepID=UPI0031F3275C